MWESTVIMKKYDLILMDVHVFSTLELLKSVFWYAISLSAGHAVV
jgi:hypothetical protein